MFRGHSVEVLAQILRPTVLKASVLLMTRNGQLGPDIAGSYLLTQLPDMGAWISYQTLYFCVGFNYTYVK